MRLWAALLPLLLLAGTSVASAPPVDGLRLGMTSTDVLSVLRTQGQPPKRVTPRACLTDLLAMHEKVVSTEDRHGKCVQEIWVRYAGGDLLLWFDEALPGKPGISVLDSIAVNYPTDMNVIAKVVQQAGPPTITDGMKPWVVAVWCFGFACSDMNKVIRDRNSGLTLTVHQGCCLGVNDSAMQSRFQNALYAALARNGIKVDND
jgi:hypothetical protein